MHGVSWKRSAYHQFDDEDGNREAPPTQIPDDGLRVLAACPNLTKINLWFDATLDTPDSTFQSLSRDIGFFSVSLRHLDIGNFTISNTRVSAAGCSALRHAVPASSSYQVESV